MTFTTAIILNAVFAVLVLAVLARIVRFGFGSNRQNVRFLTSRRDERPDERCAA